MLPKSHFTFQGHARVTYMKLGFIWKTDYVSEYHVYQVYVLAERLSPWASCFVYNMVYNIKSCWSQVELSYDFCFTSHII